MEVINNFILKLFFIIFSVLLVYCILTDEHPYIIICITIIYISIFTLINSINIIIANKNHVCMNCGRKLNQYEKATCKYCKYCGHKLIKI